VLYAATLTSGVGWDDSGELAIGVARLAPVHSAGYAPYVLLGHVFSAVVPFGSDATRANLWSAAAGALAVGLTARYVLVVSRSVAAAAVAAGLLALGPIFFYNATVASVYAFLAFAVALLLNAADAWLRRPSGWRLALLAFAIGLVGIVHAAGAAFAVGGLVLVAVERRSVGGVRGALPLAAILVPLAAVPLLSRVAATSGFPQAHVESSFWDLVAHTARDLGGSLGNKHGIVSHASRLVVALFASLSPAALVLVPAGVRRLWRERPYAFCCLVPAIVSTAIAVVQRGGYAYWFVPLVLAGAIACGAGLDPVLAALRGSLRRLALAVALLVTPVLGVLFMLHSNREASDWSKATLTALPPGARLIAPWLAYTPLRAQQVLGHVRPDVRLELTPAGTPVNIATLRGDYAVAISGAPPAVPGAQPVGPVAGASFKGLSGLEAGPFKIGFDPVDARTYRLPG
jgi:hypothetical protein